MGKNLPGAIQELEADQLVHREEYPQIPPKVEDSLTERGRTLSLILDAMCAWGDENRIETLVDIARTPQLLAAVSGQSFYALSMECHIAENGCAMASGNG